MYTSQKLPPPSSIAPEHRPLRLTSSTSATTPQPTGECRFTVLHQPAEKQRCSCQSFHHNRSVPGLLCDCGHQACFHVHQHPSSQQNGSSINNQTPFASITGISNRVQRLEEALQQERTLRETSLGDERRAREREIRILREALHPFYRSEEEMRRKLVEIEDRLDGTYDEQLRLKDRIVALDDANMAIEKRMDDAMAAKPKRRRTNNQNGNINGNQNLNVVSPDSRSDVNDSTSVQSSSQGQLSPLTLSSGATSPYGSVLIINESEEPRSSGILNLVDFPERPQHARTPREATPREEVRSSGFLEISLAERLASKFASNQSKDFTATNASLQVRGPHPSLYSRESAANLLPLISSQIEAANNQNTKMAAEVSPADSIARKRKWDEEMPLNVLANLSAASPMV